MTSTSQNEIPGYAAWMFEMPEPVDLPDDADPAPPCRSLWDLPIFGAFWAADGADLGR